MDGENLTGRRYGRLVVIGYGGMRDRQRYWRCRCDCGQETTVLQANLKSGHTKSCGCLMRQTYRDNFRQMDGTSVAMIEKRLKTPIQSNKSGYNGVYMNRRTGKWTAQITFKGKTRYLGSFVNIEEAVEARREAEKVYNEFLRWYYGGNADSE